MSEQGPREERQKPVTACLSSEQIDLLYDALNIATDNGMEGLAELTAFVSAWQGIPAVIVRVSARV